MIRRQKTLVGRIIAFTFVMLFSITPADCGAPPAGKKPPSIHMPSSSCGSAPVYTYKLVKTYPHNRKSFTQGLVIDEGNLYEGTGLYGRSRLYKMDIKTGGILKSAGLPDHLFGEGVTIYGDKVIQLTWRSGNGYIYDKKNLKLLNAFKYDTQGWGITHDGERLIMSDGTARLSFLDPATFKKTGEIKVHDRRQPIVNLNELEYIKGRVYANVWKTDCIAIIDPKNGEVTSWINLKELTSLAGGDNNKKTLNGIAYDADTDSLFVTGKLWPAIYEIKPIPEE